MKERINEHTNERTTLKDDNERKTKNKVFFKFLSSSSTIVVVFEKMEIAIARYSLLIESTNNVSLLKLFLRFVFFFPEIYFVG